MVAYVNKFEQMRESSKNFTVAFCASVITFAVLYPFACLSVDFHHDGVMLKPAMDMLSGQALHRETFTQYGPLTTWLHAAVLRLHPSLLSLRIFTVVSYAVSAFFFFLSWEQITNRIIAATGVLLFLVMAPYFDQRWILLPWSSAVALMFQSATIYALYKTIDDRHSRVWPVALGASAALTFWARSLLVGIGLIAALAIVSVMFALRHLNRSKLLRLQWRLALSAFAMLNIIFLAVLIFTGAFSGWLEQNWLWPFRGYVVGLATSVSGQSMFTLILRELPFKLGIKIAVCFIAVCLPFLVYRLRRKFNGPLSIGAWLWSAASCIVGLLYAVFNFKIFLFPEGWGGGAGGLVPFFCIVLLTGSLSSLWIFLSKPDGTCLKTKKIIALSVISLASLTQFYPTYSLPQMWWSLAPACGLITSFVWIAFRHETKLAFLALGLLLLPSIVQKVRLAKANLSVRRVTLEHPTAISGIKVSPEMAQVIDLINRDLAPHVTGTEAKAIVLLDDMPLLCTFSHNLTNPTPYFVNWPGLMSVETLQKRDNWIKENRPVVVMASSFKAIDLNKAYAFCAKNEYRAQLVVPYQPIQWWWGGQARADFVRASDKQEATAVILVPISHSFR
jgi:hypothetical protein